jgi:hypothetical protein
MLLFDFAEYDAARQFEAARACADANSAGCYQLYPGVIKEVRRATTSSGEQDSITVTSRQTDLHVSVLPSPEDAPLLVAGASVNVEWYTGNVATIWVGGRPIPTTANLAAGHANYGYIGWMLLWIAGLLLAIVLLNRRMAVLFSAARLLPRSAGADTQVLLPSGSPGWIVRPRLREALLLPLALVVLALLSIRPFMNPDTRVLAVAGDFLLVLPVVIGLALTLRNARLVIDRSSILSVDRFGRSRSWPVAEIEEAAIVGVRWTDWNVPSLLWLGHDGTELFAVTSLLWDLGQVLAICVAIGIPITVDYTPVPRKVRWTRRAALTALAVVTTAFLVASFLPLPPASS